MRYQFVSERFPVVGKVIIGLMLVFPLAARAQVTHTVSSTTTTLIQSGMAELAGQVKLTKDGASQVTPASTIIFSYDVPITNTFSGSLGMTVSASAITSSNGITISATGGWVNGGVSATVTNTGTVGQIVISVPAGLSLAVGSSLSVNGVRVNATGKSVNDSVNVVIASSGFDHSFTNGGSAIIGLVNSGLSVSVAGVTNPVCNAPSNPTVTLTEGFPGAFVQHITVNSAIPLSPRSRYGATSNTQFHIQVTGLQSGVSLNWPDAVTAVSGPATLVIVSETSSDAVYQYTTTNQANSDSIIEVFNIIPVVTMTSASLGQATAQAQLIPLAASSAMPRFNDPLQPSIPPGLINVIGCNPAPDLISINPISAITGDAPFTLTVVGSNFVPGAIVRWNLQARNTTYVSGTLLRADILASDIAAAVPVYVTVENPGPGGGISVALPFTIYAVNPVPTISSLNPASGTMGGSAFTLTVTGTNFVSGSVVRWNNSSRTTTVVGGTTLRADIPASDIVAAGTASITVFNSTPGGGSSNSLIFTITSVSPVPTVTSLSPTSIVAGTPGLTLRVFGTNFITDSKVRWNGLDRATTFVASTELRAAIPAADVTAVGTASVTVFNIPPGGGTSNTSTFRIDNPLPTITGLNPSSGPAGSAAVVVTVSGAYFVNGSIVTWNGVNLTTTYVSSSQLKATIPSANLTTAGTGLVAVVNVPTGGGTSNAEPFTINNLIPTTTSISPSSSTVGGAGFTLTVNGTKFISGSVVRWNGIDKVTTFVNSTQVKATILSSDLANGGTVNVVVNSPLPGGGDSNSQKFTVNNPVPSITGLSPSSATAGDPALTLTINGTGFVSASKVRWNGADRVTTFVSSTQLKAAILVTDLTAVATASVTGFNGIPGGGTSVAEPFIINSPVPSITSLTPASTAAGSAGFNLSVKGTGFVTASKVRWDGVDLSTKFVSATEVTASVAASNIALPGTVSVTVYNGSPGGGLSNAKTLAIGTPLPATTSITPTSASVGGQGFTLTVTGKNFLASSKGRWNGSDRTTKFLTTTQLAVTIPNTDLTTAGTVSITVVSPDNGDLESNAQVFTVNNPKPAIATLSPTLARAGDAALALTVNGSGFAGSSIVRWNGSDRPTTFLSSAQLTAAIPASDFAAASSVNVTVFNPAPGGGTSNQQKFTIGNALPSITSLSPSSATVGGAAFTLSMNGTNFMASSKVRWNGTDRVTTFVSITRLTANIPSTDIGAPGSASITVMNQIADGPSSPFIFTINNLVLSSLSLKPSSLKGGVSSVGTVTLNGPALSGGAVVPLASSNHSIATVPSTVKIPASSSSASFTINTFANPTSTPVMISANYGGIGRRTTLAVAGAATSDADPSAILFVPIVISSSGANGSFFSSALTLTNRGARDAIVDFTYTSASEGSSGTESDVLPAGQQRVHSNAINYLKSIGLSIPDSGNRAGTLRIRCWGLASSSDVFVTVRTTTAVPGGRAGLSYPGVPESSALTGPAYLFGLRQNAQDRSNLAIQNMGTPDDGEVVLSITVYSGDPANPVSYTFPDEVLPPGGFKQINGILAAAGMGITNGYVTIDRVGGAAPYYAYAVINDQANSDGSFIPATAERELRGRIGLTLPAVVDAGTFKSELVLTNSSGTTRMVRCNFVADGLQNATKSASFVVKLSPGQQAIYPDIIQTLRSSGLSGLGPPGTPLAGALFVTVDGRDASGIFVGARTSAPGGGGRYGVFYPGVPYGDAAAKGAWVSGLQQNLENRSNLALVNTGETDGSTDVFRIDLFDGESGALVKRIDGIVLGPRKWTQLQMILDRYAPGTTQGYAHVTRTSGTNPFITYAVLNDGGEPGARTGDGAYVAMEVDP